MLEQLRARTRRGAMRGVRSAIVSFVSLCPTVSGQSTPSNRPHDPELECSAWYTAVSEDVRAAEYAFRPVPREAGVWSAPNRSQQFRSRISRAGLEVFPRETSADGLGASWKMRLATVSFGRLGDVCELRAPSIAVEKSRVQLDHGPVQEWFENQGRGLEQGFSIAERPRGVEPLWIGLELAGDLSLRIDAGARSGALVDACGEVTLRYRDLLVFDATGRELNARLAPTPSGGGGIGIQIDDSVALYPLTVDPVLTGPAWTAESDQAGGFFGHSVATAGDVNGDGFSDVVVGAWAYDNGQTEEGRAFLYLGAGAGLSTSVAWTAESDQFGALFGRSVATAGDVNGDGYSDVIVGADFYGNGELKEGRAFVYHGSAAGLATTPAWTAESNQVDAYFGWSAATAGDVNGDGFSDVIVGAYGYDNGESSEGRAYVYLGSAAGLVASPAWTAESNQIAAGFGWSVATAGDVNGDGHSDVIVGALDYDNGQLDEGRAYVYLGSAAGLVAIPAWTAEGDQIGAKFGHSVATAGDVNSDGYSDVIVGAPYYDNGQLDEGRAYAYLGSGAGLSTSAAWTAESDQAFAFFGYSVATAGDVSGDGYSDVIVGAQRYDNGEADEGRAFVYLGSAAGPAGTPTWTAESDQVSAWFGGAVATAGDVDGDGYSDVIVGAVGYTNGEASEGRAFVYLGAQAGLAAVSGSTTESNQANANFGESVATAGDVNGDGFSDVIVGAPLYDNGQSDEGRAFVYLGSSDGLVTIAAWTAESNQASANFGSSVASAGDVNGDGYSDVLVGAPLFDNGQIDEGRAFVYLGSSLGLATSAAWTAENNQTGAQFGSSVAPAGDVDADGYGDVIVGAPLHDNGEVDEGRASVYVGSSLGLATSAAWTAESNQASAQFGASVASAGDVNGDGSSDVIVGAPLHDNGETDEGRAFVYRGSPSGLATSAAWTAESDQAGARFATSVSTAGDVNGDGFSDVIAGAPLHDNGETDEGRAFVYQGSSTGLATSAAWTAESDQAGAEFGTSVATAGDVNGDGFSDVLVGMPLYDDGETDEGAAVMYQGSLTGVATSPAWNHQSDQASARFGQEAATGGDVNGDGFADVLVGAPFYDNGQSNEGSSFLFMVNEGLGSWTLAAQQFQSDDSAPIHLLGTSLDKHRFRIHLRFEHSLAGFTWASNLTPTAHMEWEVAPLRTALDGSWIQSGTDQTVTGLPLVFNELAEFVRPGPAQVPLGSAYHQAAGVFHWRVRLRTNNPLLPVTHWVTMPGNDVTEAKLRVGTLPATRVPH